jgi:hypothetical protein
MCVGWRGGEGGEGGVEILPFENENILISGLLVEEDLLHL